MRLIFKISTIFYILFCQPAYKTPSGGMTTMQQFKISEDGYKILRKKWITVIFPVAISAVVILFITAILSNQSDVYTWLFVIPIVSVSIGINVYRTLRKQKKVLQSYRVTISNEGITREQLDTAPLAISFMEINEIIKTEKGSFIIKGLHRTDVVHIPYFIDDPQALEDCLKSLAPLSSDKKGALKRNFRFLLLILVAAMMICVYTVTNKIIVGICGITLTGVFAWGFYEVLTNKNVSNKVKHRLWFFLIVFASVAYITYAKLTGAWTPY